MLDLQSSIDDLRLQIRWIEEIQGHQFPGWMNVTNAMREAIVIMGEQLRAQQPKVMSVEEAARNAYDFYHLPDSVKPVFVQFRDVSYEDESITPPWRGGVNQRALLKEPNMYGKKFVFWSDRPSPEQMKEVEWDD